MAISEQENEYLLELFQNIEVGLPKMSEWQKGFIHDQHSRHGEYEQNMFMSSKQWVQVVKIGKLCGVGDMSTTATDGPLDDDIPF